MKKILAIDVGSNTIKSLLLEMDAKSDGLSKSPLKICEKTCHARISAGNGALVSNAAELISDSINGFISDAKSLCGNNFETRAVGTSALREAANKTYILDAVYRATSCQIKILSGEEEAELSCMGAFCDAALASLRSKNCVFFDLGGGSIETVLCRDVKVMWSDSFKLGAITLTREFVKNPFEKLDAKTVSDMRNKAEKILSNGLIRLRGTSDIVGSGGAVSAARLIKRLNGAAESENVISLSEFEDMLLHVSSLNTDARCELFKISPSRAEILPAAFAVICELMKILQADRLHHTFFNLRYGIGISDWM